MDTTQTHSPKGASMNYSVHVAEVAGLIVGPFAVYVLRHEFPGSIGAKVAQTANIQTRERAADVALDYRAQFGVAS